MPRCGRGGEAGEILIGDATKDRSEEENTTSFFARTLQEL
jgi:hypothetical protein